MQENLEIQTHLSQRYACGNSKYSFCIYQSSCLYENLQLKGTIVITVECYSNSRAGSVKCLCIH